VFQNNPPADRWDDDLKYQFIMNRLYSICRNISEKGENTQYNEELDFLYEHIEENIDKHLPEATHE